MFRLTCNFIFAWLTPLNTSFLSPADTTVLFLSIPNDSFRFINMFQKALPSYQVRVLAYMEFNHPCVNKHLFLPATFFCTPNATSLLLTGPLRILQFVINHQTLTSSTSVYRPVQFHSTTSFYLTTSLEQHGSINKFVHPCNSPFSSEQLYCHLLPTCYIPKTSTFLYLLVFWSLNIKSDSSSSLCILSLVSWILWPRHPQANSYHCLSLTFIQCCVHPFEV